MNSNPLSNLIDGQKQSNSTEFKQRLLHAIQQVCLLGLWRGGFFEYAAFYGGTALSIVHGNDCFSEDLDFSLLNPSTDFSLSDFLDAVKRELTAWGIDATVGMVEKNNSDIESAFIKTNTLDRMISFEIPKNFIKGMHRNEVSHVKFEVDANPPCSFESEFHYLLEPIPFHIRVMALSDIYAGKIHALLARKWQTRVKGRDWYDFIWFSKQKVKLNLQHLEARLKQSGHLKEDVKLTDDLFQEMLITRINGVDFEQAKNDVMPFIKDVRQLENWSPELFSHITATVGK